MERTLMVVFAGDALFVFVFDVPEAFSQAL
jgi:hypothetical protein